MTNDECRKNDERRNPKESGREIERKADDGADRRAVIRLSDFLSHPSFDIYPLTCDCRLRLPLLLPLLPLHQTGLAWPAGFWRAVLRARSTARPRRALHRAPSSTG